MPAYNEQRTIVEILESISAQKLADTEIEVIVVDDGSDDQTVAVLESRPDLYSKFIKNEENGGKGSAVRDGLRVATGEYILFQDADLEYDPSDYKTLWVPASKFEADVIMGSRFVAPQYTRVSYFWHRVGNRFITLLFNIMNNTTFTDIYSCYLMYRRILVDPENLRSNGWEQHAEILSTAVSRAEGIYEVPISYHGRTYEEGKKIKARHILAVLWMIVKMRLKR